MTRKSKKIGDSGTNLYLRVLGYKDEDAVWAAHCLETDIVGHGDTFEAALADLIELTEMQVSFAIYKNQPALLDRPASTDIVELYQSVYRNAISKFNISSPIDPKRTVTSIPWPRKMSKADSCFVPA
jgi:hypothetical protein